MISQPDGLFINLARLNIGKYAARPNIAKALFEYILYHENLVREAMDLASQVRLLIDNLRFIERSINLKRTKGKNIYRHFKHQIMRIGFGRRQWVSATSV